MTDLRQQLPQHGRTKSTVIENPLENQVGSRDRVWFQSN